MATWTVTAQLTTGTLSVGATDRIWLMGAAFNDDVLVSSHQSSIHITNSSNTHQCTSFHVNNVAYVDSTHFTLNGGGSTALASGAPTQGQCPLKFNFSDASSVTTSASTFYAYDGITDATAMAGVTFYAIEQSNTSWTAANGSGSALTLASQTAATSHDWYIALSATPTSTGAKSGSVKLAITYV